MPDILSAELSGDNAPLVFTLALFYAAISGQSLELGHRVALVYAYCLVMHLIGAIDTGTVLTGSLIVLFLILEVFTNDQALVSMYSIKYKFFNCFYTLFFEFYVLFYFALLAVQRIVPRFSFAYKSSFSHAYTIIIVSLILVLAMVSSRRRFASKPVSTIMDELGRASNHQKVVTFTKSEQEKLNILFFMEDRSFLTRGEFNHNLTIRYALKRVADKARRGPLRSCIVRRRHPKDLLKCVRGYGTIEMQILRNVGLEFGSYQFTLRRKIFELVYAQAVFNSYLSQFSPESEERRRFRNWIARCYLNVASTKIGLIPCRPSRDKSTFAKLFNKEFSDLSKEEFFVWCLGLPHYRDGVGDNAIEIHKDALTRFELDIDAVREAIRMARNNTE